MKSLQPFFISHWWSWKIVGFLVEDTNIGQKASVGKVVGVVPLWRNPCSMTTSVSIAPLNYTRLNKYLG